MRSPSQTTQLTQQTQQMPDDPYIVSFRSLPAQKIIQTGHLTLLVLQELTPTPLVICSTLKYNPCVSCMTHGIQAVNTGDS